MTNTDTHRPGHCPVTSPWLRVPGQRLGSTYRCHDTIHHDGYHWARVGEVKITWR